MLDGQGRRINYLRVSITDRCNLRCIYCMPAEGVPVMPHAAILSFEEIETVCRTMADMGLRHIRLTGGEPLVRRGCADLAGRLKQIPGIETVTLTTNGILLPALLPALTAAGIDGINLSLDTLDAAEYARLTRGGSLTEALQGLEAALAVPDLTVKVNCVLMGDNWQQTAVSIAALAKERPIHVRFIEEMPLSGEGAVHPPLREDVLRVLEQAYGASTACAGPTGIGPAEYVSFAGFCGKVGFISALSHKFCAFCNRVRLTADGQLRLCLQSANTIDLRSILRTGTEAELRDAIIRGLAEKPSSHCFDRQGIQTVGMAQIGG